MPCRYRECQNRRARGRLEVELFAVRMAVDGLLYHLHPLRVDDLDVRSAFGDSGINLTLATGTESFLPTYTFQSAFSHGVLSHLSNR
jgi:hypothetical protein